MEMFKQVIKHEVDDIVCDLCGDSCKIELGEKTSVLNYASIEGNFNYYISPFFSETNEDHLCEGCYKWLIKMLQKRKEEIKGVQKD